MTTAEPTGQSPLNEGQSNRLTAAIGCAAYMVVMFVVAAVLVGAVYFFANAFRG